MAPKLYGLMLGPPTRAVFIFAKNIGLDIEFIPVDIRKGEHMSESFLKINPHHTIPTLDDDGYIIWDSHAIMIYLADKYGNNNPLYPQDIQKRGIINRMLFFECGEIFPFHKFIAMRIIFQNCKDVSAEGAKELQQGYNSLEKYLSQTKFIAGNTMTIADLSIWTTLSNATKFVPIDENKYPNIIAWTKIMDESPNSEININGAAEFKALVEAYRST